MCTDFLAIGAIPVPETVGEHLSLWAIRVAMLLLVLVMALELRGWPTTSPVVFVPWLLGAIAAFFHSLGALATFHHGSHAEAMKSTAEQTEELLGVSFAAGLYFNYVFVLIWMVDSLWRIFAPIRYARLPVTYHLVVNGFLLFIAFNGTVVFKTGWFRWAGIASTILLTSLWLARRNNKRLANEGLESTPVQSP